MREVSHLEQEVADLAARLEAYDSLYAIRALSRGMREVRGRKTIVYLAEDHQIPESAASVYDATLDVANRANVTVHTVDARGLAVTRPGDASTFGALIGNI